MQCVIVYKGQKYALAILAANYKGKPTLLGKNWLGHVKLEWGEIFIQFTSANGQLDDLLSK